METHRPEATKRAFLVKVRSINAVLTDKSLSTLPSRVSVIRLQYTTNPHDHGFQRPSDEGRLALSSVAHILGISPTLSFCVEVFCTRVHIKYPPVHPQH